MKKLSVVFSAVAFMIALAGAVSFAASPVAEDPAWVNTLPNPDVCTRVPVTCNGTQVTCVKFVPDAGSNQIIHQYSAGTTCSDILKMNTQ